MANSKTVLALGIDDQAEFIDARMKVRRDIQRIIVSRVLVSPEDPRVDKNAI